jgi:hypothetical protein
MRFRKFLEITSPGFISDRDNMDVHSLGHQPELPDRMMQLGTDEIEGEVVDVQRQEDNVILKVKKVDGEEVEVSSPRDRFRRHGKEMPQVGDSVRLVMGDDGAVQDYEITH